MKVEITESDLKKIVSESVEKVLNEVVPNQQPMVPQQPRLNVNAINTSLIKIQNALQIIAMNCNGYTSGLVQPITEISTILGELKNTFLI